MNPTNPISGQPMPTSAPETDTVDGPVPADPQPPTTRRRSPQRRIAEWVGVLVIAAVVAIGLRSFVVQTFFVPSGSMLPTLQIGDRILVDKLPFFAHSIHRGDIVVFRKVPADTDGSNPSDLVKRVIGLPGETISSRGDTVLINGKPIKEPWLPNLRAQPAAYSCNQTDFAIPKTTIASGHYFMMGDCRGNSFDSRAWGTVPVGNIIGRVFVVLWRHNHPWFHWF